ncbi:GNAT family N-acetyltransferase [Paenibacillus sp. CN-4]|uniref:GNAT family N-acetyltransferase n=1 Tax=Paenibacillus nanchangensis TaxID=3348343 RepID=UPI00397AFCB9
MKDWTEIEELQRYCEQYEGITLKLNWDMLRSEDAWWATHQEDGLTAGFIGVYGFGPQAEVCGMVRPGYRRRGIFTSLWTQALVRIREAGHREVLLNTPANSASGQALLQRMNCEFQHSEYQMKWNGQQLPGADADTIPSGRVNLRPALPEEAGVMVRMDAEGFGMEPEEASEMYDRLIRKQDEYIMIELNGDPVGKLRLWTDEGDTWIYGFTVMPEGRGKGIGRSALLQTIDRERRLGNGVCLEVALDNPQALKLYQSCGFETTGQQDYFRYNG